ncbi:hypothetical protein [Edaphobacter aggregans]|uniref:hypothetical protein n=1 Tax=Edaphobacter aggregans TaxID=570835 RepID=UPI000557A319|nr:hypothetical protein [Edaphobacter aggregans]
MPKKLLFVTVLLLLVSVQALAASCDVRCSLMGTSGHVHAWHADEQMFHCSGMSMESDKGASLSANDSCVATTCGTALKAINKGSDQNDADSSKLLVSAVALLVDPFGSSGPNRTTPFASLSQRSDSTPLAQRPGSSLRI